MKSRIIIIILLVIKIILLTYCDDSILNSISGDYVGLNPRTNLDLKINNDYTYRLKHYYDAFHDIDVEEGKIVLKNNSLFLLPGDSPGIISVECPLFIIDNKTLKISFRGGEVDIILVRKPEITIDQNVNDFSFLGREIEIKEELVIQNGNSKLLISEKYNGTEYDKLGHAGFFSVLIKNGMFYLGEGIKINSYYSGNEYSGFIEYFNNNRGIVKFINGTALYFINNGTAEFEIQNNLLYLKYRYDTDKISYKESSFGLKEKKPEIKGEILREITFLIEEEWKKR